MEKICFIALLLISVIGCQSQTATNKTHFTLNNADILPNHFDWHLGREVFKTENGNLVLSTISVKLVLGMLYEGALGNTATELEDLLGIDPKDSDLYIAKFLTIIDALSTSEGAYEFDVGTKLFLDKTTNLNSEYDKKLTQHFNSTVETVNFRDQVNTTTVINNWVRKVTHGKIQNLVTKENAGEGVAMLLLSAMYFRGYWAVPFPENLTKKNTFYLSAGYKVEAEFMSVVDRFFINDVPEIDGKIVRLPYQGDKFAMYVILPNNKTAGLGKVIDGFSAEILRKSISTMTDQFIQLELPKFHFESTLFLAPVLKKMGLKDVFTSSANLTNIGSNPRGSLFVSNVLQKAGLEVNEKGSTAYAATVVELDIRIGHHVSDSFIADHPFVFVIMDEIYHVIAFVGKVNNPLFHGTPVVSIPIKGPNDEIPSPQVQEEVDKRIGISPIIPVEHHVSERFNFFDYELLQKVAQIKTGNILLSPESIKSALSLVMEGAKGKTEQEIRDVLRLTDDKTSTSNLLAHRQVALREKGAHIALEYQNKIFLAHTEKLNSRYQSTIKNQYYSEVQQVNFMQPETVTLINNWVNNSTHGLIPTLVAPGDFNSATKLFLANCIYFKGHWLEQFNEQYTTVSCFNINNNTCQKSYMMQLTTDFRYSNIKALDAAAIELPFQDKRYAMIILLPNKKDGLNSMLRDLQYRPLNDITNDMQKAKVNLILPRFTIEFSSSLVEPLQLAGIKEVFGSNADLSGMTETKRALNVGNIVHKAKIEVNELGAKAAAASGATIVTLSLEYQVDFIADHPFIFFIRDKSTNGVLFEGILSSPDKAPDSIPLTKSAPSSQTIRTRISLPSTTKYQQPGRQDPDGLDYALNGGTINQNPNVNMNNVNNNINNNNRFNNNKKSK